MNISETNRNIVTNTSAPSSTIATVINENTTNPVQSIAQSAQLTIANVLGALATVTNNRNSSSESNPVPKTASSNASIHFNGSSLTQEMAEAFSKKLTPAELKIIITMSEKLKKQTAVLDEANVSKEDMKARLTNAESIRDFLVEKLKNAGIEATKKSEKAIAKLTLSNDNVNELISRAEKEAKIFVSRETRDDINNVFTLVTTIKNDIGKTRQDMPNIIRKVNELETKFDEIKNIINPTNPFDTSYKDSISNMCDSIINKLKNTNI
jgi:hypothetical protein